MTHRYYTVSAVGKVPGEAVRREGGLDVVESVLVGLVVMGSVLAPAWRYGRHRLLPKAGVAVGFEEIPLLPPQLLPAVPRPSDPGRALAADRRPSTVVARLVALVGGQKICHRYTGSIAGRRAWIFDVTEASRGLGRLSRPRASCVVIDSNGSWPWLWAERARFGTRAREAFGARGIETGDADFDQRYFLRAASDAVPRRLLTDRVRQCLLRPTAGPLSLFVSDGLVLVASRGHADQRMLIDDADLLVAGLPDEPAR